MTRIINVDTVKKLLSEAEIKKLNESLVKSEITVKVPMDGKDVDGTVIFRRKAAYGKPFENKA